MESSIADSVPKPEKKEKREKKEKKRKTGEKKQKKSICVAQFTTEQLQEFKEAFNYIDSNNDGLIDEQDIRVTGASFGRMYSKDEVDSMLGDSPTNPINFPAFLTCLGDKMAGTDSTDTLINAFLPLDENLTGTINKELLKEQLCGQGDRLSEAEYNELMEVASHCLDLKGEFDYRKLVKLMTGS